VRMRSNGAAERAVARARTDASMCTGKTPAHRPRADRPDAACAKEKPGWR
jgi:hypothetical protein